MKSSFQIGDIISYLEMCSEEKVNLQKGMNYSLGGNYSVILMSLRENAPYADRIEDGGKVLIYEGHDWPHYKHKGPTFDPKSVDQPMNNDNGTPFENGKFYNAAIMHRDFDEPAHVVRVYEKIRAGIWSYNGFFDLVDAQQEDDDKRKVFKFRLVLRDQQNYASDKPIDLDHNRLIPSTVKLDVWRRDEGKCVQCGSTDNLHYDHILPFSKGGTSITVENIQILCARHNLQKSDKII